jgi:hypothetical protein
VRSFGQQQLAPTYPYFGLGQIRWDLNPEVFLDEKKRREVLVD